VYVAYYPDAAFPGAADEVDAFARRAVDSGVERLVLLADRGAAEAERCETAVRRSGADWTIVRVGFITQNFGEGFLAEMIRAGVVALPVGDVAEPFTDADDIADVAATALTEPGHAGRIHELTGPRLMTFADAIAEIARILGREIAYQSVAPERFVATLTEKGVPPEQARALTGLMVEVFDGRRANLTDGVQRAVGHPPRDIADYADRTAATGIWSLP
jgi:uncharacterized protein YbjT (DUF2867 family)